MKTYFLYIGLPLILQINSEFEIKQLKISDMISEATESFRCLICHSPIFYYKRSKISLSRLTAVNIRRNNIRQMEQCKMPMPMNVFRSVISVFPNTASLSLKLSLDFLTLHQVCKKLTSIY